MGACESGIAETWLVRLYHSFVVGCPYGSGLYRLSSEKEIEVLLCYMRQMLLRDKDLKSCLQCCCNEVEGMADIGGPVKGGGPLSEGPQDNTKSDFCLVDSVTLIRWRSSGSKHVLKTTTKS
ncbi:hypothetical protein MKW98_022907 [Papaver atlanticum]|uniref:Uncharacterized protein n=1 Tax=Papaver atlanticum TaxID=357466 RepID=A0AAD4TNQ7_9MAGN|nr:hypothetical protein MKW98_022907 [Papaver atlanticum]